MNQEAKMIKIKNRFTRKIIFKSKGADLRDADLRGADLRDADLRGVKLFGAKTDVPILFFQHNQHVLQKIGDEIRIGCEVHSVKHWLKNYKEIGKLNNYLDEEIKKYGEFINKNK